MLIFRGVFAGAFLVSSWDSILSPGVRTWEPKNIDKLVGSNEWWYSYTVLYNLAWPPQRRGNKFQGAWGWSPLQQFSFATWNVCIFFPESWGMAKLYLAWCDQTDQFLEQLWRPSMFSRPSFAHHTRLQVQHHSNCHAWRWMPCTWGGKNMMQMRPLFQLVFFDGSCCRTRISECPHLHPGVCGKNFASRASLGFWEPWILFLRLWGGVLNPCSMEHGHLMIGEVADLQEILRKEKELGSPLPMGGVGVWSSCQGTWTTTASDFRLQDGVTTTNHAPFTRLPIEERQQVELKLAELNFDPRDI